MKPYFSRLIVFSSLIVSLCFIPGGATAQPVDPGGDVDLPIDGGMSLLIAAGLGYGVKKIREERKKKANQVL